MRKTLSIFKEVISEGLHSVAYFAKHNLRYVGTLIEVATPYMMYVLGQKLATERGVITVGGELFVPLFLWLFANFIKGVANKVNRGARIPKPDVRFTEVDEDGVVTVSEDRLEELLVYVADLEDWMERRGWL